MLPLRGDTNVRHRFDEVAERRKEAGEGFDDVGGLRVRPVERIHEIAGPADEVFEADRRQAGVLRWPIIRGRPLR